MKKLSKLSVISIFVISLITFAIGYLSYQPVAINATFGCYPGQTWECNPVKKCPPGYVEYGDPNLCRKESINYASPICPTYYHYQNGGNWNQRCHRNDRWTYPNCWTFNRGWEYSCPEITSPTGCPSGYVKDKDSCSQLTYQYANKITDQNCHCVTKPSPTPSPIVTQSPSPTVTPNQETLTPTPTIPDEGPTPTSGEENPEVTPVPTSAPSNNPPHDDSGSSQSNPAPVCNDTDPGSPSNLQVVALGGGKVRLTWNDAPGPHTSYAVAYGPSIGNYLYGDPNVGNVTSYVVSALNPGGKYCFYVQAQNGCRGGSPSNVVCSNQGAGSLQVLGASTNYNPLVTGIKESYGGQVLGAATSLANTAEVSYSSEKLPSGNTLDPDHTISIPAIGLNQPVYLPQKIGDELVVGSHEVLSTQVNGTQLYYGHNATDVFGSLYKLHAGEKIQINQHGQTIDYLVTKIDFVSQNDVAAVHSDTDGGIVLMTCSYTYPDHRILVKAVPVK